MIDVEPCDTVDLALDYLGQGVNLVVTVSPPVHVHVARTIIGGFDAQCEVVAGVGGKAGRRERPCHRLVTAVGDDDLAGRRIHFRFRPLFDLFAGYLRRIHVPPLRVGGEVDFDAAHARARTGLDRQSCQCVFAVIVRLSQPLVGHDVNRIRGGFRVTAEVAQHIHESKIRLGLVQQGLRTGRKTGRVRTRHADGVGGGLTVGGGRGAHPPFRPDFRVHRILLVVLRVRLRVGRLSDGGGESDERVRPVRLHSVDRVLQCGCSVLVWGDGRRDGRAAGDNALRLA